MHGKPVYKCITAVTKVPIDSAQCRLHETMEFKREFKWLFTRISVCEAVVRPTHAEPVYRCSVANTKVLIDLALCRLHEALKFKRDI